MERRGRARGPRSRYGATASVVLTGLVVVGLVTTGSIGSTAGAAAVVALMSGWAIALGVFGDRNRCNPYPTRGVAPDGRTAALAEHVLGSLDGIEYRRVELGAPWPQLSVGPTGVVVVDVCGLAGPVTLGRNGIRGRDDRRSCHRCDTAFEAAQSARRALAPTRLDVPVRTLAVMSAGTSVTVADDAPPEVSLITVDELADALARGPVLPMPVVDASFAVLSGTVKVAGRN